MLTGISKKYLAAVVLLVFLSGSLGYAIGVYSKGRSASTHNNVTISNKDRSTGRLEGDVDFNLYWQIWDTITDGYYKQPVQESDLFYSSLEGLVSGLKDPYSVFLKPEDASAFNEELSGNFEGIGAEIGIKNEQLTVIAPLPNTPASNAGLLAGDKIVGIDGLDTSYLTLNEAVNKIRGPRGTSVVLTIVRSDRPLTEFEEITVTRDVIYVESVSLIIRDDDIAVITLSNFNEDTRALFAKVASEISSHPGLRGIILDVRNNPGGFLDTAVKVSGYWTGDKPVVFERFSGGNQHEYQAGINPLLAIYPTVVLINGGSASASEIVAGALKDYNLATLIGETTFGKGTVQTLEPLPDGSYIKYTIAEWLTPNGGFIDDIGIEPDILVERTIEDYENDLDPQLERAIQEINSL